ncbi:MAG: hypothetical protein IJA56_07230 [Clostridia bacterium]|nr:hypothetical protein [Clostridia bacterium]
MREPDELLEEENPVFTLTDEDGQELSFLLDATLEFENKLYAVLYPYDPEKQEVIDDKVFFVLDDDDTMTAINTDEILAELDQLYAQLDELDALPETELQ